MTQYQIVYDRNTGEVIYATDPRTGHAMGKIGHMEIMHINLDQAEETRLIEEMKRPTLEELLDKIKTKPNQKEIS